MTKTAAPDQSRGGVIDHLVGRGTPSCIRCESEETVKLGQTPCNTWFACVACRYVWLRSLAHELRATLASPLRTD